MRGYPAWPAKVVEQRNDGKYAVIFFGTLETANVQPTDIWPYDMPNTTKFCSEKNLSRPFFMEGMEQMKQVCRALLVFCSVLLLGCQIEMYEAFILAECRLAI